MFAVGDMVAYPMHGAGIIQAIEEKEVLGKIARYYILKTGGMKVMVPVEGVEDAGMRHIICKEECQSVLEYLSSQGEEESDNWNRRYRDNLDKMRTGDVKDVADVVRSLTLRDRAKGLSTGEKKMLAKARNILASELMLCLSVGEEEAFRLIEQAV